MCFGTRTLYSVPLVIKLGRVRIVKRNSSTSVVLRRRRVLPFNGNRKGTPSSKQKSSKTWQLRPFGRVHQFNGNHISTRRVLTVNGNQYNTPSSPVALDLGLQIDEFGEIPYKLPLRDAIGDKDRYPYIRTHQTFRQTQVSTDYITFHRQTFVYFLHKKVGGDRSIGLPHISSHIYENFLNLSPTPGADFCC